MKQVVFAVFLIAMASLTGCLNEEDSSDTTEDNTDTKDDGLIDPVGQTGDTIPENSDIFIDSSTSNYYQGGKWDCAEGGDIGETECDFVYHGDDYFSSNDESSPHYYDADFNRNTFDFNGWVNKTGETVTIEGLFFPERNSYVREYTDWFDLNGDGNNDEYPVLDYTYLGRYVTSDCQNTGVCEIIFYGYGGLMYNGEFTMSSSNNQNDWIDTDGDGSADLRKYNYFYEHFTVTFDLPFDPYAFSIIKNDDQIDRIF